MIEERSAGAVVYHEGTGKDKRFFLVLHYPAGHWDFPKGAVEKGETEEEAARREIKEETGLVVDGFVSGFSREIEYHYRRGDGLSHKSVIFFITESKSMNVKISFEHTGYDWLPFDRSMKRLTFDNARKVLNEANLFLSEQTASQKSA